MSLRSGLFATAALLLGAASAVAQGPVPVPVPISVNEYSAKFLCGDAKDVIAARPGNYATTINIHNPQYRTVMFSKKAVRSPREGETPIPPGKLRSGLSLEPDFAEQVDCKVIRDLLGNPSDPFIEGFVVLYVLPSQWTIPNEFDVVGVYTVDTPQQSISLEIVPVAPHAITLSGAEDLMQPQSKPK
jgi:hypothetical protein